MLFLSLPLCIIAFQINEEHTTEKSVSVTELTDESSLYLAAKLNKTQMFISLLKAGGNPYESGEKNFTSLHWAVSNNNIFISREIVTADVSKINYQTNNGSTALHLAAKQNHTAIFELLLSHGGNPFIQNALGSTSLHEVVKQRNVFLVNLIIHEDTTGINIQNSDGKTALHLSIELQLQEISELLLSAGASPLITDNYNRSPLHAVIFQGFINILKLMLGRNKTIINTRDPSGFTVFHLTIYYNQSDMAEFLIKENVDPFVPTRNNKTPLHTAVQANNIKLVELILRKNNRGIDIQTSTGETALFNAAMANNSKIFQVLMQHDADPNIKHSSGMTSLHIAAKYGNIQIAKLIFTKYKLNIDLPNNKGANALYIATFYNRPNMVQFLLDKKANPNMQNSIGILPIHVAAQYGYLRIINLLIKTSNKSINMQDYTGSTPLYTAIYFNQTIAAEFLMSNGADPGISTYMGKAPLHIAAFNGNKRVIFKIFRKNIQFKAQTINLKTTEGFTVLHMACQNNALNIIMFLILLGADPNITSNAGWLPLHVCAENGYLELTKKLLNITSNINKQNNHGYTAVMVALLNERLEMTKFLLESGADPNIGDSLGTTLIHVAAQKGIPEILRLLITKNKSLINTQDSFGYTPLMWSIHKAKLSSIEFLLKNNASVLIMNNMGQNFLHYVPKVRNITIIEFLFKKIKTAIVSNKILNFLNQQDIHGLTPLSLAAEVGNAKVFNSLLENGANPNIKDYKGQTLLHRACLSGNVNIVKYILENTNQSKNTRTNLGLTPLMLAATNKGNDLVNFLIDNGTKVEGITSYNVSVLHFAAMGGNVHTIHNITKRKEFNINAQDVEGYTPLMIAAQHSHRTAVSALMLLGADPIMQNIYGENAIALAVKLGYLDTVALFSHFEYDADYMLGIALTRPRNLHTDYILYYLLKQCSFRSEPIFYAAATGNDSLLITAVNNMTHSGNLAFKYYRKPLPAIMEQFLKEYYESIKDLLNDDDDSPQFNEYLTPIDVALLFLGRVSTINLLLQHLKINMEFECRKKKWSPLDFAIFRNNIDLIVLMINICGSPTSKVTNKYGWTATHKAVWSGNVDAFNILKKYEKELEQPDIFNRTPLHLAAIRGNRHMVKPLCHEAKHSINSTDMHGFTPLHLIQIFCQGRFFLRLSTSSTNLPPTERFKLTSLGIERDIYDYYASALILMTMSADLDAQDKAFGWTPLHWAAANGEEWMANMLVSRGARVNLPSWDEETPMKIARKWGKTYIYNYLKTKDGIW